jgi:hypothetical protein
MKKGRLEARFGFITSAASHGRLRIADIHLFIEVLKWYGHSVLTSPGVPAHIFACRRGRIVRKWGHLAKCHAINILHFFGEGLATVTTIHSQRKTKNSRHAAQQPGAQQNHGDSHQRANAEKHNGDPFLFSRGGWRDADGDHDCAQRRINHTHLAAVVVRAWSNSTMDWFSFVRIS